MGQSQSRLLHSSIVRPLLNDADLGQRNFLRTTSRIREPKEKWFVARSLLGAAALVLFNSAAASVCHAQGVDDPLTAQQFNDYEQGGADALTNTDLQYLSDNRIRIPNEVSKVQIGGLHRVINEPKTQKDAVTREKEVNYYLDLVVEQTIHCAINPLGANCDKAK